MKLLSLAERFLSADQMPTVEVEHVDIQPDPERSEWIARKVEAAKKVLGQNHLCHPSNRVQKRAA